MNDPYKASVHDITIFCNGLMTKIPKGKKVNADKGYRGKKAIIAVPQTHMIHLMFDISRVRLEPATNPLMSESRTSCALTFDSAMA
jgi:hypothetical protein